jgi:2,4-dienoyl-CoA reductase-like NADH-dependent reductase (Old Yellow Enzyme family)
MRIKTRTIGAVWTLTVAFGLNAAPPTLPVRGLHVMAPKPDEMDLALRFVREALAREGVNTLVMEFDYRYQFTRRSEVTDQDALSKDDVKKIVTACHQVGVRLIPQINCLGHQSWAGNTAGLLRAHPELDERSAPQLINVIQCHSNGRRCRRRYAVVKVCAGAASAVVPHTHSAGDKKRWPAPPLNLLI